MTKVLIKLRGCADWSAPVLFANPRRQVLWRQDSYHGVLKGVPGRIFLNYNAFLFLKDVLIIANSVYPDEMQHYANVWSLFNNTSTHYGVVSM